jgi:hypothetical protein
MNHNMQWSLKFVPLQVYKLSQKASMKKASTITFLRSFHVRSFHILHQKKFVVFFFLSNEVDVEIVIEKHIYLL